MKIGIDARLINQTGVGRYTRELIKNLGKIDHLNGYVIFLLEKEFQDFKISGFKKKLCNIRWHSLKEQLTMPWILWREHFDLIHFPYFSVPVFYPGRFIVTIHDLILDHFDTGKASTLPWVIYKVKRWAYKIVMWTTLYRAIKIIAVSEATKREIVDHYKIKPEKIVVTYEAAGELILKQVQNDVIKNKYFLYVGNAYPHKNLERLIGAFASLKVPELTRTSFASFASQKKSLKLILVGPDDYFYQKLKEKVQKMGLADQVIFHGPATKEELTDLYKNALALIFPSLMEGFGLPGIEAMTNGCPVLCSDIPVFHEIYGNAAIYFDPQNVNDMAEKIYKTYRMDDSGRKSLKLKGLKQAKKYSWQKLARQTLDVYKSI